MRDRVVLWVLGAGALIALTVWLRIGPWPAMVVGLVALLLASVAYRIEPPRIDLDGPLPPLDAHARVLAADQETVDQ